MPEIEEIHEDIINENLKYDVFINKGIFLIDKIYSIIKQYNTIKNNTELLINEIQKKIIINIKEENYEFLKINSNLNNIKIDEVQDIKNLIKNIMKKLYDLDILLNNYIENFKNYIYYKYLQIKELYKNDKHKNNDFFIYYENEIKEIDKMFFRYKKINTNDEINDLFEHIINISNVYVLVTKNILSINIVIKIGEILKKQNTIFKIIYKDLIK